MKNFAQFMKQAQQIQQRMTDVQGAIEKMIVSGESGGGMVKVEVNGKGILQKLKVDASLLKPEDVDIVEDLIIAAYRDAQNKADQQAAAEMEKVGAGLGLPAGMGLPF